LPATFPLSGQMWFRCRRSRAGWPTYAVPWGRLVPPDRGVSGCFFPLSNARTKAPGSPRKCPCGVLVRPRPPPVGPFFPPPLFFVNRSYLPDPAWAENVAHTSSVPVVSYWVVPAPVLPYYFYCAYLPLLPFPPPLLYAHPFPPAPPVAGRFQRAPRPPSGLGPPLPREPSRGFFLPPKGGEKKKRETRKPEKNFELFGVVQILVRAGCRSFQFDSKPDGRLSGGPNNPIAQLRPPPTNVPCGLVREVFLDASVERRCKPAPESKIIPPSTSVFFSTHHRRMGGQKGFGPDRFAWPRTRPNEGLTHGLSAP